jgi:hypothetical protein
MNVLGVIDRNGEVTNVALEAQVALQNGDTTRSAHLFNKAGEMLESSVERLAKASDRDLARFFAATHYFKGGAYQETARVCGKIREQRLPARFRHLYPPFLKDVRERSAPDYVAGYDRVLRADFQKAIGHDDPSAAQRVIDILKDHPYILKRPFMAYVRARCCEVLGIRQVATSFFRHAWRFEPDNPLYSLAYLDSLCKEGKHVEAWAVVEERLEQHSGALSSIYAMSVINAILERDRAASTPVDEQVRRREELLRHFASALGACQSMAPAERSAIAPQIDYAFLIAWVPYTEAHDVAEQMILINRWIELNPDSPHPRVLRRMITDSGEASAGDAREGIRQAERYINELSIKRFDEISPILDASLV